MARVEQQNLPLPETQGEGFEEQHFLRLQANRDAFDALIARQTPLPASDARSLPRVQALCGPAKCGKSHLGEIWRTQSGARVLSPSLLQSVRHVHDLDLDLDLSLTDKPLWLDFSAAEDPAQGMTPSLERMLYTLYNEVVHNATGSLLITTRSEPSRWQFSLPDLRSRMRALTLHRITDPSFDDSARLLEKIFRTRQLEVDARVYAYVHRRIERSFRAHHAVAEALDALSMTHQRKITLPFVARHLSHAMASLQAGAQENSRAPSPLLDSSPDSPLD